MFVATYAIMHFIRKEVTSFQGRGQLMGMVRKKEHTLSSTDLVSRTSPLCMMVY